LTFDISEKKKTYLKKIHPLSPLDPPMKPAALIVVGCCYITGSVLITFQISRSTGISIATA